MDSPNNTGCRSYKSDNNGNENNTWLISKSKECHHECTSKKCMSWWKWIIKRMGNKRRDSIYNFLWTGSPFPNSVIYQCIDDEGKDDRRKYHECCYFVAIIMSFESIKPKSYEIESCPYHDGLSCKLYEGCIFRSDKWSCPDKELCIEGEEGL